MEQFFCSGHIVLKLHEGGLIVSFAEHLLCDWCFLLFYRREGDIMLNKFDMERVTKALKTYLRKDDLDGFREKYLDLHPYDQAVFFRELNKNDRLKIYTYLSPKEMSDIMENIELEETEDLVTEMDPHFASMILAAMAVDDAVDILQELTQDQVASFLVIMDKKSGDEIKTLLHYEDKTAGSIMTTEYISVLQTQTAAETLQQMKLEAPEAETIYYTYVLDESKRLVGVLSLRDLIVADGDELIGDIMSENVVSISVGRNQEEIAQMVRDYDFLAVPVVDFQNHLLGIITVDDIMDVMEEEASDDYSKFAALIDFDGSTTSPTASAKKRLPWLITLLFLGIITAKLIDSFEATLNQVSIMAIFIPLIAGMAGNAGTQSLAVAVRGLATDEYGKDISKFKMIMKELTTGLLIGVACGILVTLVVYVWKGPENLFLGVLVGITIFATLIIANLSGALIPLLMERLKIDPAVASGPFITTLNDITSVLIYFGLATAFMSYLI